MIDTKRIILASAISLDSRIARENGDVNRLSIESGSVQIAYRVK